MPGPLLSRFSVDLGATVKRFSFQDAEYKPTSPVELGPQVGVRFALGNGVSLTEYVDTVETGSFVRYSSPSGDYHLNRFASDRRTRSATGIEKAIRLGNTPLSVDAGAGFLIVHSRQRRGTYTSDPAALLDWSLTSSELGVGGQVSLGLSVQHQNLKLSAGAQGSLHRTVFGTHELKDASEMLDVSLPMDPNTRASLEGYARLSFNFR